MDVTPPNSSDETPIPFLDSRLPIIIPLLMILIGWIEDQYTLILVAETQLFLYVAIIRPLLPFVLRQLYRNTNSQVPEGTPQESRLRTVPKVLERTASNLNPFGAKTSTFGPFAGFGTWRNVQIHQPLNSNEQPNAKTSAFSPFAAAALVSGSAFPPVKGFESTSQNANSASRLPVDRTFRRSRNKRNRDCPDRSVSGSANSSGCRSESWSSFISTTSISSSFRGFLTPTQSQTATMTTGRGSEYDFHDQETAVDMNEYCSTVNYPIREVRWDDIEEEDGRLVQYSTED